MLQIKLSDEQTRELAKWPRDPSLKPAERDRVEMLALLASDWPVAKIASHLGNSVETERRLFRRFPTEGFRAIRHQAPGPAPDLERRQKVGQALEVLLRQERTWTAGQLAEALAKQDIKLSARQLRKHVGQIEPFPGAVKYTEVPERTYPTMPSLLQAIDLSFTRREQRLPNRPQDQLPLAAWSLVLNQ